MYLRCGIQWEFRYIKGIIVPPAGAMIRGKALDQAANEHYRLKVRDGTGLKVSDFRDIAVETHDSETDVVWDESRDKSRDMLVKAAEAYHTTIATQLTPRSEEDVQLRLDKKIQFSDMDIPIICIIDLVTAGEWIIDTKLKGKVPSQAEVDRNLQLSTYAMATGLTQVGLAVAQPSGKATLVMSTRGEGDTIATSGIYRRVWQAIKAGIALPPTSDSWACTEKWCGYWNRCRLGKRNR